MCVSNDTFLHRALPLNPPLVLYEIRKNSGKIQEKSGKNPGFQKCSKWPNLARNAIKNFRGYFSNILFSVTRDEKLCFLSLVTKIFYWISRRISAFRTILNTARKIFEFFFTIRKNPDFFEFSNFL